MLTLNVVAFSCSPPSIKKIKPPLKAIFSLMSAGTPGTTSNCLVQNFDLLFSPSPLPVTYFYRVCSYRSARTASQSPAGWHLRFCSAQHLLWGSELVLSIAMSLCVAGCETDTMNVYSHGKSRTRKTYTRWLFPLQRWQDSSFQTLTLLEMSPSSATSLIVRGNQLLETFILSDDCQFITSNLPLFLPHCPSDTEYFQLFHKIPERSWWCIAQS